MRLVVLVALAGCGRIAFDDSADATCNEPWSAPQLVDLGGNFYAPSLRGDGLELYLDAGGDLYVATRATRNEPFGAALLLPSPPNTPLADSAPRISNDGLELVFSTYEMGTSPMRRSRRVSVTSAWEPVEYIGGVFGSGDLSRDRLTLYASDYQTPISKRTRSSVDAAWGPPVDLPPPVNVPEGFSGGATITSDDLELYFGSSRASPTMIYSARRTAPTAEFSTVERIEVPNFYTSPEISADGHFLHYTGFDVQVYVMSRCE